MDHRIAQKTEGATENMSQTLRRGDRVAVRAAGGRTFERFVWEVGEAVVYVCSRALYEDLRDGKRNGVPIGFPMEDVHLKGA